MTRNSGQLRIVVHCVFNGRVCNGRVFNGRVFDRIQRKVS